MSSLEKKFEEELERIENAIEKELRIIDKKVHQHNLFPLVAGGLAVFFLMVSMVVVAPYMLLLDVAPSSTAHEYTTLQATGRNLFMTLGCFYCHSQQVRLYDWGIGNVSQQGDYVYDSPHALGTERTGPDLAQIGGMRPTIWHALHDRDPRSVSPGSIMPNFGFLTDNEIEALTAYIQNLGQENLQVESSVTNGSAYHPSAPANYANETNPYSSTMQLVLADYDSVNDVYDGDSAVGDQWGTIFDAGKMEFTQLCLACHGCSGNAQGPYARHVVTQPANLHERIATFQNNAYHIWRVSEGVPGTAMPAWALSLNKTQIMLVAIYEQSFVFGSARTISGDISDMEGDYYANTVLNAPPIAGTMQDFENGKNIFNLYCAQCHGQDGQGDGPASIKTAGGYISPEPANFTESGSDFQLYGRYVWKVREGVETTNMPPWRWALNENETYQAIFYLQSFSTATDYSSKWGPQYSDPFARNLMSAPAVGSMLPNFSNANPFVSVCLLAGMVLWNLRYRRLGGQICKARLVTRARLGALRRRTRWT
jgi:cytochrome c oxidase cbb3-type subunit I/II